MSAAEPQSELKGLRQENQGLRRKVQELQGSLDAIRSGQVDAVVIPGPQGEQVYALKGVNHSYRVLIEEMQAGAMILAEDGTILYANSFMGLSLGRGLGKVIGARIQEFVAQQDQSCLQAMLENRAQKRVSAEVRLLDAQGTSLPVYISIVGIFLEDTRCHCLAVTDLSEIKRQERLLAEERLSRSIIEQAAGALVVCDEQGKVIRASQMANDLAGGNCLQRPFDAVFALWLTEGPGCLDRQQQDKRHFSIAWVIAGGQFRSMEAIVTKAGSERWFLLNAGPLLDDTSQVIGGIVNLVEITEKRDLEQRLSKSFYDLFESLSSTLVQRDAFTVGHQQRVAQLAWAIALYLDLDEDRRQGLYFAALSHDIGKIAVPAEILTKPSKLSDLEFELIKMHPQSGYEILKRTSFPWPIAEIVLQHHERLDGSGYPQGLKGEEILLEAKILAVADVVEAMASDRPYRPGLGITAALKEIEENKGKLYDPEVVDACLTLFREQGFAFKGQ